MTLSSQRFVLWIMLGARNECSSLDLRCLRSKSQSSSQPWHYSWRLFDKRVLIFCLKDQITCHNKFHKMTISKWIPRMKGLQWLWRCLSQQVGTCQVFRSLPQGLLTPDPSLCMFYHFQFNRRQSKSLLTLRKQLTQVVEQLTRKALHSRFEVQKLDQTRIHVAQYTL